MAYFKINNTDLSLYVSGLKITYNTIVGDDSGRNADGNMVFTYKTMKRTAAATFRPMLEAQAQAIADLLIGSAEKYARQISFQDPLTGALYTGTFYHGDVEIEYYTIQPGHVLCKEFSIEFVEV